MQGSDEGAGITGFSEPPGVMDDALGSSEDAELMVDVVPSYFTVDLAKRSVDVAATLSSCEGC